VTGFEAFWYSHVLLLLAFPLAVFHGSRRPLDRYPTTSVSSGLDRSSKIVAFPLALDGNTMFAVVK
jgi:hypothetical protein